MTGCSNMTACALGRHMTVEFYDCEARILADTKRMEEVFLTAAKRAGATVIASHFHDFEPQGVSGVVIISESHFAVHAWPEHDYAAVDLFTCGDKVDFYTNNAGGINGGISNGNDITLSVAVRPTPSISKEQNTVDLINKENTKISIKGRHDACIVLRAVPCVESAIALAILDEIL